MSVRRTSRRVLEDKPAPVEWRTAMLIIISSYLVVIGLFWQTIRSMIEVWAHSRTFAHGFLILPACLYLLWCYHDRLVALIPTSSCLGLLLLTLLGAGWLIGDRTNTLLIQQVVVLAMFPGLVWATVGTAVLRALLFPLGFLVFALPIGTSVEPWLQDVTAAFIVAGLQLSGIPVHWEAHLITISSHTWEVVRDCGGLRYVLPGLALGYLFVAVMYRQAFRRIGFLLLCVALLIVANGLRAFGIILGDYLEMAEGTDHRVFSYAIYGITMVLLIWLGLKWKEPKHHERLGGNVRDSDRGSPLRETVLTAVGAVALLAIAPLFAWLLGGPH